jgi:F-box and leucine-rich repeat protein GRR1
MSVFELAGLQSLRRLSLVRVHKLTDIGIFSLAEHATRLERLHLSYCDHFSLDAIHLLLRKLDRLQHFTATGIPSLKRIGIQRFSAPAPDVRFYYLLNKLNIYKHITRTLTRIRKRRFVYLLERM